MRFGWDSVVVDISQTETVNCRWRSASRKDTPFAIVMLAAYHTNPSVRFEAKTYGGRSGIVEEQSRASSPGCHTRVASHAVI
jgi:hypothetical protein